MSSTRSSPARVSREATPSSPRFTHPDIDTMLESSEEDDAILRPRGRLAARMQQQARANETEFESENDTTDLPQKQPEIYEGVRIPSTEDQQDTQEEDEDEDVVVTARPRKLLSRRQRSTTPESRPQQHAGSSPGLFVSPSKPQSPSHGSNAGDASDSDPDLPTVEGLAKKARLLAFEAKKRSAREAREAEEARRKAERLARQQSFEDDMSVDEVSDISDDDGGRKLTQRATRPAARKASKKALEEMNRETQRLTRSLQLAHEVKVKKKITKASLFERFNFKLPGAVTSTKTTTTPVPDAPASSSRANSPISHPHTDAEDKDTPPSSPPAPGKDSELEKEAQTAHSGVSHPAAIGMLEEDENGDLPTLESALATAAAKKSADKGKGKEIVPPPVVEQAQPPTKVKRNLRVRLSTQVNTVSLTLDDDDDDDLTIQPSNKGKIDDIFNRVPINQAKESRPLQMLRRLAHLDDPERQATAPISKKAKQAKQPPAMTVGELEMNLLQRARLQAKTERDRHLELLRSKGIHVQTAEEREKEMAEVEDIVARARKEAEELMQREREAAKVDRKARKEAGEADPLGWDDSDESDDDYQEVPEQEEMAEVELSGSEEEGAQDGEDEDVDMDGEEEDAENADPAGALFDDAAESGQESEDEEAEQETLEQDLDVEMVASRQPRRKPKKHIVVLSDDEEEEETAQQQKLVEATPRSKANYPKSPSVLNVDSPKAPTSVLRSATKSFIPGLPVAGPAGLGLTQIFAGTMDDSQVDGSTMCSPSQPMPTFNPAPAFSKILNGGTANSQPNFEVDDFPDSNFSQSAQEVRGDMILDSQPTGQETQNAETQGVQLRFSQSQMHGFDSFMDENQDATQASDLIEPTQDGGFQNFSPLKRRFVERSTVEPPISTVETVKVDGSQGDNDAHSESPLVRRTGKLRRKADLVAAASARASPTPAADQDEDGKEGVEDDEFGFGTVAASHNANAFAVMKEAAAKEKKSKAQEAFDKKKSKAREMVEDQAEESEDEYAGLGGADGEDDSDDDNQSVVEMIDDETKNNEGDERKIAAFYADRERAADEKQVDKLFHDITTGMLRRKRGGDWDDLSDEDDGGEARRRMKRRQFAKMQRALFADERISKVAENPRNQAFLRTIEEHGSDDDMDFIFAPPPAAPGLESQDSQASVRQETIIPNSQPQGVSSSTSVAPAANPRRTRQGKRPSHIGDIRESLSNLLDQPLHSSSVIPATDLGSDDDDNDEETPINEPSSTTRPSTSTTTSDKENRNPRRRAQHVPIVDRITLKRNSSSSTSTSSTTTPGERPAFATAPSLSSSSSSFKVPALLRRATTNSLMSGGNGTPTTSTYTSNNHSNESGSGSVFGEDAKIKKTTTTSKRSGINYFARENERRAAMAENERRREAKKWKGAEGRSKVVGGLFGAGKFE